MTTQDTDSAIRSLQHKVSNLEDDLARRRLDGYARLYGPAAVLSVALTFLPILGDVEQRTSSGGGTIRWRFGSLWQMVGNSNGASPAVIGMLVVASLVVFLVVATMRVDVPIGVPIAVAGHAAVLVLLLAFRPGTGEAHPPLTDAGWADLAVLAFTGGVALVHANALRRRR